MKLIYLKRSFVFFIKISPISIKFYPLGWNFLVINKQHRTLPILVAQKRLTNKNLSIFNKILSLLIKFSQLGLRSVLLMKSPYQYNFVLFKEVYSSMKHSFTLSSEISSLSLFPSSMRKFISENFAHSVMMLFFYYS